MVIQRENGEPFEEMLGLAPTRWPLGFWSKNSLLSCREQRRRALVNMHKQRDEVVERPLGTNAMRTIGEV